MAEIKSTLDLIMEKTRNLTMSEEDRRELALTDLKNGLNKLVLQYLQGEVGAGRFREEYKLLENAHLDPDGRIAAKEIAGRIEAGADNQSLLTLLREGCGVDVSGLEGSLRRYAESLGSEEARISASILKDLERKGIAGAAVVPNPDSAEQMAATRERLRGEFKAALTVEIDRLN